MSYTVGCVPYVNAIPLVAWFEQMGEESPVKVLYDVPSRLPAMLDSGQADAILVSSVDAFLVPGRRMAEGVCIGSHGPVKSVRLFSRVEPSQIRTLALDESSMTSNRLAQIILSERFGVKPKVVFKAPNAEEMLAECDACVLIGDIGMTTPSDGLHVLDLGEEWKRLTGMPFVWAAWIGNEGLTPELALWLATAAGRFYAGRQLWKEGVGPAISRLLMWRWYRSLETPENRAYVEGQQNRIVQITREKANWTEVMIRDYYFKVMVYEMDGRVLDGLREFRERLLRHDFSDCIHFPGLVAPALPDLDAFRRAFVDAGHPVAEWVEALRMD